MSLEASAPLPSKWRALRTRLTIGPLLLATLAGIYWVDHESGRISAAVLGMVALVGLWEYITMMRGAGFPVGRRYLLAAALILHVVPLLPVSFSTWKSIDQELFPPILVTVGLVFVLSVSALARSRTEKGFEEVGSTLLGLVLLSWPLYFAQGLALRDTNALFFVVIVAKGGDIGAYFAGIAFGRRKLIPWVSRGKTFEGAVGGLLASCLLAWALSGILLTAMQVGTLGVLGIALAINVTSQLGDLIESLLKRRCGVKDSSSLLPVHGGMLDLIDSLLFAAPTFFFLLVRFTEPG